MNKIPNHSARRPLAEDEHRPDAPNPSPMRWHEPPAESVIPPSHQIPRRKK